MTTTTTRDRATRARSEPRRDGTRARTRRRFGKSDDDDDDEACVLTVCV